MNSGQTGELIRSCETFPCADGFSMKCYISRPRVSRKLPSLLFVYEAFGLNSEMKRLADDLAMQDYGVMIPDLFSRGSWFSCIRKLMHDLKAESGQGVSDLLEARKWLIGQDYAEPDRVGVMGFCMGGGFALLLSKTGLFRVSAPFYGQVPKTLEGACPIVGSYGERDAMTRKDAHRLQQEVQRLGIPSDVKIYPDAGHSFMNEAPNLILKVLGPWLPPHAAYDAQVAADASRRLVSFLREHL